MTKKYTRPMTLEEMANASDEDINFDDIPPLDEGFWENIKRVTPQDRGNRRKQLQALDPDVLDWFKKSGKGWEHRLNTVLRHYIKAH